MAELLDFETEPEADAPTETGAAGIAIAIGEARHDPGLRDNLAQFLSSQEAFLAQQGQHLHDLRHHMRLKAVGERLKVVFHSLVLLVGALLVGSLGAVAWNAYNDHGLVIESLGAPADLALQGATGLALSGELQDKLAGLQDETAAPEAAAEVREKTAPKVKVEIPETGVSVGELSAALEDWLGHQTRVSGDVLHVANGPDAGALALNLRVGSAAGVRLVQADGDLEALLGKGAEHLYASTQPFRYIIWLDQHGRTPEAVALAEGLADSGTPDTRARALGSLESMTLTESPVQLSLARLRRAVSLGGDPIGLGVTEQSLGHWQTAYQWFTEALRTKANVAMGAAASKTRTIIPQTDQDYMLGNNVPRYLCFSYNVSPCTGGGLFAAASTSQAITRSIDSIGEIRLATAAKKLADGHDPRAAAQVLTLVRPADSRRSPAFRARVEAERINAMSHVDFARQDWPRVLQDAEAWRALAAAWPGLRYPDSAGLQEALALAALGQMAEANTAAAAWPADCYPCVNMRARLAALGGRWGEAEQLFAEAARQGPALPFADTYWGAALLAKGDAKAAITHFAKAARLGPEDADPLELWGEALLAQGQPGPAADKFEKAAALTPAWGRLHLKWGEALAKAGRADAARKQLQGAASLFLTAADRAELQRHVELAKSGDR